MSDEQMAQVWPVSEACHGFSFLPASSWFGIDHWVTQNLPQQDTVLNGYDDILRFIKHMYI
jgi:hypothetical protein